MAVKVVSSGPRGRKTYEIRWKNGESYGYTDNASDARRLAVKARKEERAFYNRKNPGTKAERQVRAQKASAKRRVAVALAKYLKQENPSAKLAGAKVEKLAGGVLKITPIKMNPTPPGIRAQGGWSWAVYAGKQYLGSVIAPGKVSALKKAKAKWSGVTRVAKHGVQ